MSFFELCSARKKLQPYVLFYLEEKNIPDSLDSLELSDYIREKCPQDNFNSEQYRTKSIIHILKTCGYVAQDRGISIWISTATTSLNIFLQLYWFYSHMAAEAAEGRKYLPPSDNVGFRAHQSFDYMQIAPYVFRHLLDKDVPEVAISVSICERLPKEMLMWMDEARVLHCISRALNYAGYVKRSKRGAAWDKIGGSHARVMACLSSVYEVRANLELQKMNQQQFCNYLKNVS